MGLPGRIPPYCAFLEYSFRRACCNSHSKIVLFLKKGRTGTGLPYSFTKYIVFKEEVKKQTCRLCVKAFG